MKKDRPEGSEVSDKPSLEDLFWGEPSEEDEEFDQDLLELTRERQRGSVLRPVLMILIIFLIGSVIYDWRDELVYFFSSSEPLEMGEVTDYPFLQGEDPEWRAPTKHNRYVAVEGMPTRISRGGKYEFFRLIGGEFYVQRELTEEDLAEEGGLPTRQEMLGIGSGGDRVRYHGQGRLMAFAKAPERFRGLKDHYEKRYNTRFCEDYSPRQQEELRRQAGEQIYDSWARRYENADEEERERRGLKQVPTEAEVAQILERNPVCVQAYLIHDGQKPIDMWRYMLFSSLLALLMLFNIVKLVQWFRAWFRS